MTLARFFAKLRHDAGMSLRAVASRTKPRMDPSTVLKIEKGRKVKAATLGQALRAMGLKENDGAFLEAFALWSSEQSQIPVEIVERANGKSRGKNAREIESFLVDVVAIAKKVPETDRPLFLEAIAQPEALKLWLQSTRLAQK
jgi:hypothetical protein